MMVANSFDLWQKDAFFAAAEEVQESADVLASTYKMWVREKRAGRKPEYLDDLCRELQAALATAKWQLEEFEKAVILSDRHCRDDTAASRHGQFVSATENKISEIEAGIRATFSEEGKQPLRWVNLDEDERNDLAMFLSGTSQTSRSVEDECISFKPSVNKPLLEICRESNDVDRNPNATRINKVSSEVKAYIDAVKLDKDADCVIDIGEQDSSEDRKELISQPDKTNHTRRTRGSQTLSPLKIVVAEKDEERNKLMAAVEATPKEKGSKSSLWLQRWSKRRREKIFGGGRSRRPLQVTFILVLTFLLFVPFVFYSG